tara:strand:- start:54 stop:839 length:786 start_codon:yes stop_codon:yes gene_type:complete
MLKKRLIFTLLFNENNFVLSRNFGLQKVGDLNWLEKNYRFSKVASSIDELIILDVSRTERDISIFSDQIKNLTKECFVPIAAGGGIKALEDASIILRSGADKIVLNSLLFEDSKEVEKISKKFGKQSIVASVDLKKEKDQYRIFVKNGLKKIDISAKEWIKEINRMPVGEIIINSIDQDGTAQGLDLQILDLIDQDFNMPLILAGGAGHHLHISKALEHKNVDAVSTAHLFNFVGDGLKKCRDGLISEGFELAYWEKNIRE